MPHHTPLISTIVVGLVMAFALGAIAHRFRLSPIIGYLLAGVLAGPFTPGYVADQGLANQLAEIGVILLMFGVGLHFSSKICSRSAPSRFPAPWSRWPTRRLSEWVGLADRVESAAGLVFGLALSVASTVVLLRALQERRLLETERGRIAVGWLIVEDLAMVLALVLLPAFAEKLINKRLGVIFEIHRHFLGRFALRRGRIAFVAIMLIVGRRVDFPGSCTMSPTRAPASCSAWRTSPSRLAPPTGRQSPCRCRDLLGSVVLPTSAFVAPGGARGAASRLCGGFSPRWGRRAVGARPRHGERGGVPWSSCSLRYSPMT